MPQRKFKIVSVCHLCFWTNVIFEKCQVPLEEVDQILIELNRELHLLLTTSSIYTIQLKHMHLQKLKMLKSSSQIYQ